MLAPERTEDADLQLIRLAPDGSNDGTILVLIEGDGCQRLAVDNGRHQTATRVRAWIAERNRINPSSPPSRGSQARSGCGIKPTTLPCAFEIPAMFRAEPLGFAS